MKVLVFSGSTRKESFNRKLAREAASELRAVGAEVTLAELSDYAMPLYDGDSEAESGLPQGAREFKKLLAAHDGIVIASPEYNGSFPALVKNVIDWSTRPEPGETHSVAFRGKTVALLSTSPGPGAGRRGLRHLRELLEMIGANVVAEQVTIPKAFHAFSPEGGLTRPEDREAVQRLAARMSA